MSHAVAAHCDICAQLAGVDRRYVGRLLRDSRARDSFSHAFALSMGLCAHHANSLSATSDDISSCFFGCIQRGRSQLASFFERANLRDELIQDILFSARDRCPICTYFQRIETRLIHRTLHVMEHESTKAEDFVSTRICFAHAQALATHAMPPLRTRLVRALRSKARTILELRPQDSKTYARLVRDYVCPGYRLAVPEEALPLPSSGSGLHEGVATCPICIEASRAREPWLHAVAESIRLQQSEWLILPTCRKHFLTCVPLLELTAQRAVVTRYLEAGLTFSTLRPIKHEPPKRRKRDRRSWFDTPKVPRSHRPSQAVEAPLSHPPCPGCDITSLATQRAVAALLHRIRSCATESEVTSITEGVCLKHFAEALVYAPDSFSQARLSNALLGALMTAVPASNQPKPLKRCNTQKANNTGEKTLPQPLYIRQ